MKFAGFLLLLAGWGIVLAALVVLTPSAVQTSFALAGVAVEILGLALVLLSHTWAQTEKE